MPSKCPRTSHYGCTNMSDLLFKCISCRNNLCVNDVSVGKTFSCPTCKNEVVAPEPDFSFGCPHCNADFTAPDSMAMKKVNCPICENNFTIPAVFDSLPPAPKVNHCPSCWTKMPAEVNICGYCLRDIRTGKKSPASLIPVEL